jgi:MSHA biogenesis protein MshQ
LNAYGSELLDLPMAFRTEFWNGTGWTLNSADVCTGDASLGAGNAVTLSLAAITPALWTTCVWDSISPPSNLSGIGCATAAPAGRKYLEGATPTIGFAGDFNLWLRAPGAGHAGSGLVTPTVPTWLGVVPPARATFGIYKTPIIYMRENY